MKVPTMLGLQSNSVASGLIFDKSKARFNVIRDFNCYQSKNKNKTKIYQNLQLTPNVKKPMLQN